jgi:hypothetical protein
MIAVDDFTFGFNVGITVSGSVLFRLVASDPSSTSTTSGRGVVLFRVGLHTGFIPPGAFRVEQGSMDRPRAAAELGPSIIAADFVFSADSVAHASLDGSADTAMAATGVAVGTRGDPPPPDFEVMPSFAEGLAALSASHYEEVNCVLTCHMLAAAAVLSLQISRFHVSQHHSAPTHLPTHTCSPTHSLTHFITCQCLARGIAAGPRS